MTVNEIKAIVEEYYSDKNFILTKRLSDILSLSIKNMIDSRCMLSGKESVIDKLGSDITETFVRERQPRVDLVEDRVVKNVKTYFEKNFSADFLPISIARASNYPEDLYLYQVIAVDCHGMYACWTSWNDLNKNLNHGHYNLKNKNEANNILKENFNDMTGEIDKFGPECSVVQIASDEEIEAYKNKEQLINNNVVPLKRKGR